MGEPELVRMATIDLTERRRLINAYLMIDGRQVTVSAHGSQRGKPGYVRITVEGGGEVPCPHAERYGHAFNEEWFKKYLEANMGERR